jgi:ribonuclease P protein component
MSEGNTLPKTERLYHKKLIDSLFGGGKSRSMTAFPLRLVYMPLETTTDKEGADSNDVSQMLISVPKRNLHRANKRNRVKRLVREAYRKHKTILAGCPFALAFIWLDPKLWTAAEVEQRVVSLLSRVMEKSTLEKDKKETINENA